MDDIEGATVPAARLASFLGLSTERVRQLVNSGHIPRQGKAKYPVVAGMRGYIEFLQDENKRVTTNATDSGLKAARQREVEIRIARDEGRLVDMEDVEAVVAHVIGTLRAELAGVPASASRDRAVRASVEQAINGALSRCAGRIGEASAALRAGRDPLEGDAEDDA